MKKIILILALLNVILCLFGGTVLCNFQSHGANINIDYKLRCSNGSSYQTYEGNNIAVNTSSTTTESITIATNHYPVQLEAWQSNSTEPIFTINHFVMYAGSSWTSDVLTVNAIAVYLRLQSVETSVTASYTLHCDDNSTYTGYNIYLEPDDPTLVYIPINANTFPIWLEVDGSSACGHDYVTTNEFEFDQVPELMDGWQYWWNGHDYNGTFQPLYVQGYPYENVVLYVYSNIDIEEAEITYRYDNPLEIETTIVRDLENGWNSFSFEDVGLELAEAEAIAVGVGGEEFNFDSSIELVYNAEEDWYENHDIKFYFENKEFHDGWNWESFPKLTINSTNNNGPMNFIPDLESNIYPGNYEDLLLYAEGNHELEYFEGVWTPYFFIMWSTKGVKIELDNDYDEIYIADGTRVEADTEIDLHAGWNWIGYWLQQCQDMNIAFGENQADDFWQYVEEVKSEHWYYGPQPSNNRGEVIGYKPSLKMRALEYGKSYEVKLSQAIDDFYWQSGAETSEGEKRSTPENFSYEDKADYEVIDVLDIPENITEIGVFQDDTCVGAIVVEESSEQILVYTESASRDQIPFEFVVVTNNRSFENILNYQVFNKLDEEFENRSLIAGSQSYSVIRFGSFEVPQNDMETIESIKLIDNYPNPFNPTTNISFSLPVEQEIELVVYNMKGQIVRTLVHGQFASGENSVTWDGKDYNGKNVGSGLYFYKLLTSNQVISKKMLLLK